MNCFQIMYFIPNYFWKPSRIMGRWILCQLPLIQQRTNIPLIIIAILILSALEQQSTPIGYQHFRLFFYYIRFEQNQEQKFKLFISLVEFALDIVALCFCHLRGCNLFHSIGFKYFWRMKKKFHFYYMYKYSLSMIGFALLNQASIFGIFIQGYYNYYSRCPG